MSQAFPQLLVLVAVLSSLILSVQSLNALVTQITKDDQSSLYSIAVNGSEKLVIDLDLPLSWILCKSGAPVVLCHSAPCPAAESYNQSFCGPPLATADSDIPCRCLTKPANPITKVCAGSQLTSTSFSLFSTDGHNPLASVDFHSLYVSCAPTAFVRYLPQGALGMASLSLLPLSLPSQFSPRIQKQFGICLPSDSGAPGVAFFGKGPFYLLPPPGRDVTSLLSFTPLLKPKTGDPGYYIGLTGMTINAEAVMFPNNVFDFDAGGHGGVKLSTVVPYTTLRSSIYHAFLKQFDKATSGYPRVKNVEPFGLCFNITTLGGTRVGLPVPQIVLQLTNGSAWSIFGANSMKLVTDDVACLAFVDGGENMEQAVVIGSFQMQDNFFLFDLVESRLGFTPTTLLWIETDCYNFNFTSGI